MSTEATEDYSKGSALDLAAWAVLGLAAIGGILLIAAELSTVVEIRVGDTVRAGQKGHHQHGWALLVLGLAALPMGWGAARAGALPAIAALAAVGVVALAFALVVDLPDTRATGLFGSAYEDAEAGRGPGLALELIGAALLLAAAGLALARRSRR